MTVSTPTKSQYTPIQHDATGRILSPRGGLHRLSGNTASTTGATDRAHAALRRSQREILRLTELLAWCVYATTESIANTQYYAAAQHNYAQYGAPYTCSDPYAYYNEGAYPNTYPEYAYHENYQDGHQPWYPPPETFNGWQGHASGAPLQDAAYPKPDAGGALSANGDVEMLRDKYMEYTMRDIHALQQVGHGGTSDTAEGGEFLGSGAGVDSSKIELCESAESAVPCSGTGPDSVVPVFEVIGGPRGTSAHPPSGPANPRNDGASAFLCQRQGYKNCNKDRTKNLLPMERSSQNNARHVPHNQRAKGGDSMGAAAQNGPAEAGVTTYVHGYRGVMDKGHRQPPEDIEGRSTIVKVVDAKTNARDEEVVRPRLQQPQHQVRGDLVPTYPRDARNYNTGAGGTSRQARERGVDSRLRQGAGGRGLGARHAAGHQSSLIRAGAPMSISASIHDDGDDDGAVEHAIRHTITRMRRTTRVARGAELKIKMHMKPTGAIDIERCMEMMLDDRRERFNDVWNIFLAAPPEGTPIEWTKRTLQKDDCVKTCAAGNAEIVTAVMLREFPTTEAIRMFTIIEERDEEMRRRLIGWTQADNARIRPRYDAQVPLHHVSYYLDAVNYPCGGKRDLQCGFYGMVVPPEYRAKFRFRDNEGTLYQMTVATMGHCCTPELMHTLTAVIGGHPDFVKPKYVIPVPVLHVFIDGLRPAGTTEEVRLYLKRVDARANDLGATWKPKDSVCGGTYEFDGVSFNHNLKGVAVGAKLINKLKRASTSETTLGDLETLVAQLCHASAIVQACIPDFYHAIKYVRRQTSKLNRGVDPRTTITVSPRITYLLDVWIMRCTIGNFVKPPPHPVHNAKRNYTMFTDAAKEGWGAVLICNRTGRIWIAGARWPREHVYEVNKDETGAVANAVEDFSPLLERGSIIDLRIDNTSAEAATKKGQSSSEGMSISLGAYIRAKRAIDVELVPKHVASKDNWSDPISRGLSHMWRKGCCETGGRGNSVFTPFEHDVEVVNPLAPKRVNVISPRATKNETDSVSSR